MPPIDLSKIILTHYRAKFMLTYIALKAIWPMPDIGTNVPAWQCQTTHSMKNWHTYLPSQWIQLIKFPYFFLALAFY